MVHKQKNKLKHINRKKIKEMTEDIIHRDLKRFKRKSKPRNNKNINDFFNCIGDDYE